MGTLGVAGLYVDYSKPCHVDLQLVRLHEKGAVLRIFRNGDKHWYLDNVLHRADGPAVEEGKNKEWWLHGKRHRDNDPAVEHGDGTKMWFVNGACHRVNGPAIEHGDGDTEWFVDNKRHRTDGPAVEKADGKKEWWVDGKRLPVDVPMHKFDDGTKVWYKRTGEFVLERPQTASRTDDANDRQQWCVGDVQAFLLQMSINDVPLDVKQRAAESAGFHRIDGRALSLIDTVNDVRCAFGVPAANDCGKVLKYLRQD